MKQKAYMVHDEKSDMDYSTVVFAETRGQAKVLAQRTDACEDAEYTDIRAIRIPELDSYYRGVPEMDWYNEEDQVALVRYGHMHCTYELDLSECPCSECNATEWCDRYEQTQD